MTELLDMDKPSSEEHSLHMKLAELESMRIKISEVYERWLAARVFVADACQQLTNALTKWRKNDDQNNK